MTKQPTAADGPRCPECGQTIKPEPKKAARKNTAASKYVADGRNYSQAVLTTLPSDGPMSAISATRSLCRLPTASSCSDQSKQ